MSASDDHRLEELFLRYWDNALTDVEAAEFADRLRTDPEARERLQFLSLQVVTAADRTAIGRAQEAPRPARPGPAGRWTRRRVLRVLGGGLAAGVVAGVVGRQVWPGGRPVRMSDVRGAVRLVTAGGEQTAAEGGAVPPGATVSTYGLNSTVLLTCPDGTGISLAGDSSLTVEADRRLILRRGNAIAAVRPALPGDAPLMLSTTVATLTTLTGASLAIGHALTATEVGVREGQVTVSDPAGEPLAVVQQGEMLTVRDAGQRKKQPFPPPPDAFAWDLSRPLPEGWHIGSRAETPDGPVVRPAVYDDPYHNYTPMYQVRSDKQWLRGFCQLERDSVVRVRYRVDRPGEGQVVLVVRNAQRHPPETGVLEINTRFVPPAAGHRWSTAEARAADMLDCKEAARFDPPWVAFLVIFNTYQEDLNLQVAEFGIRRPLLLGQ